MRRPRLVLASQSPQRRAILEQLGIAFEVRATDVEEKTAGEARAVVRENAVRKAHAAAATGAETELVLAADTEVVLDGRIYGKAADVAEARTHLEQLSGRAHDVWTGVALLVPGGDERTAAERTTVTFRRLERALIEWYLESGEWRGRAGSYAIQGRGAALVRSIAGDYWNVVGLPVACLLDIAPSLLDS